MIPVILSTPRLSYPNFHLSLKQELLPEKLSASIIYQEDSSEKQ